MDSEHDGRPRIAGGGSRLQFAGPAVRHASTAARGRWRVGTPGEHEEAVLEVQIFGTKKNADTRKALRFFAERRVRTHFVDLAQRAASPGELRRFAQKFGTQALVDRDSKRFAELGLGSGHYTDERWLARLADEPLLLRQPLVRNGSQLTIGLAEATWKEWTGR